MTDRHNAVYVNLNEDETNMYYAENGSIPWTFCDRVWCFLQTLNKVKIVSNPAQLDKQHAKYC